MPSKNNKDEKILSNFLQTLPLYQIQIKNPTKKEKFSPIFLMNIKELINMKIF
jgi:hypothetical protein